MISINNIHSLKIYFMGVGSKHIATFLLGAAAALAAHKYMTMTPEEKEIFGYDTASLDWWEYWIDIHIPALRRWTYPLIEGRPLEAREPRVLQMPPPGTSAAGSLAPSGSDGGRKTGTNGATWQFS